MSICILLLAAVPVDVLWTLSQHRGVLYLPEPPSAFGPVQVGTPSQRTPNRIIALGTPSESWSGVHQCMRVCCVWESCL